MSHPLVETAALIDAYLKLMEARKLIPDSFKAGAHMGNGGWVYIRYSIQQPVVKLRKRKAVQYLAWLEQGNRGTVEQMDADQI